MADNEPTHSYHKQLEDICCILKECTLIDSLKICDAIIAQISEYSIGSIVRCESLRILHLPTFLKIFFCKFCLQFPCFYYFKRGLLVICYCSISAAQIITKMSRLGQQNFLDISYANCNGGLSCYATI
eukprot:853996_1